MEFLFEKESKRTDQGNETRLMGSMTLDEFWTLTFNRPSTYQCPSTLRTPMVGSSVECVPTSHQQFTTRSKKDGGRHPPRYPERRRDFPNGERARSKWICRNID